MADFVEMGARRFGRVNWLGLLTLIQREIMRFVAVWTQTLLAPLITAGLFLAVFALAIGPTRGDVMGVPFVHFLAPGILMMTVIQNAFANTSSSIMSAKVQGNIVDTLMPPLSPLEMLAGYIAGSIARALFVATAILAFMVLVVGSGVAHPLWVLSFVVLGAAFMGGLGMITAIFANRFDQQAAISNFIITPLSFLSGTFYSIEALPDAMKALTRANPVFYLIDGVRFGMLGQSDSSPWLGLIVVLVCVALVLFLCWFWLKRGYRLKA